MNGATSCVLIPAVTGLPDVVTTPHFLSLYRELLGVNKLRGSTSIISLVMRQYNTDSKVGLYCYNLRLHMLFKSEKNLPQRDVRELPGGYCAAGNVALLVALAGSGHEVDQEALVAAHTAHFESWGTTDDELVAMTLVYFKNVLADEHLSWNEVVYRLHNKSTVLVVDFMDDTYYVGTTSTYTEGHCIIVTGVDLERRLVAVIDPTNIDKFFDYEGRRYYLSPSETTVPLGWLNERWHDVNLENELVNRWGMFVDLSSLR